MSARDTAGMLLIVLYDIEFIDATAYHTMVRNWPISFNGSIGHDIE